LHAEVLPLAAKTEMVVWVRNTFNPEFRGHALGRQLNRQSTKIRNEVQHELASKRFDKKFRAGVLGATGMVGQRIVHMLANHRGLSLRISRRRNVRPQEIRRRREVAPRHAHSEAARNMVVKDLAPNLECDFVFSALDSSVAGTAEEEFVAPAIQCSAIPRITAWTPMFLCSFPK